MRSRILFTMCCVSVLVGQPSFTAATISTSADGAFSVFAADMDNDGDMDILSASRNDDKIAWYENDGAANPSWTAGDIATNADGAYSVFAADMDNDGDMDILSAFGQSSLDEGTIAWYENDGAANPSWTAANITTNASGLRSEKSIFVADMDNDGDMDIVAAHKTITWYENDGAADPSWTAADIGTPTVTVTGVTGVPYDVYAADMDNDGDMDIVSSGWGFITWYENDGAADPSWTAADIVATNGEKFCSISDMDNDGDLDIVSVTEKTIIWYENNGAADPSWTAADIGTPNSRHPRHVFVADMDNDGDMDFVVTAQEVPSLAWYENDGAADPSWTAADITSNAGSARTAFVADMDNDGDMDIVAAHYASDAISWCENTMDVGHISGWTAADITTSADAAESVFAIDMDDDGDVDVISFSGGDDKIAWYENNGSQGFTAHNVDTDVTHRPFNVSVIDLDQDGDKDILTPAGPTWYQNNGSQSFTKNNIDNNNQLSAFSTDLDRDGDFDIITGSYDGVYWYQNNGSESFTKYTIHSSVSARSVHAADMDNDGDIDVLAATFSAPAKIYWYENNGSQSFTIATSALLNGPGDFVKAVDLDRDGDMDAVSVNSGSGNGVKWHENNGSQSFTTHSIYQGNAGETYGYGIADLDKDGDIDIVGNQFSDGVTYWLENNGAQSFTYKIIDTPSAGGTSAFIIDMDGDGNLDVLSSNYVLDAITWYKQSYDAVVPTVSSVSSSNDNGTYKVGDVIAVTVAWNEAATVTGTPRIKLETGTTDQYATYASGSTTTTLTFNYTVASGDTTADLDYTSTSALELNSGTIKDASGNVATLTLASPAASGSLGANKAIVIDGNVPTVTSVTSTKTDRGYTVGTTIPITITFNQTVTVTGTPQLTLETGTTDAVVDYASGTGTAILTFNYVVAAGQNSSDLDYTSTSALALNSGTIKDASGNAATLTLPTPGATNSLGANKALIIDTTSPTVSTVSSSKNDAAYKVGESIPVNVNFDDKVYVTGTPQLTLETGTTDAVVDYSSGSESTTLTFNYIVVSTHNSSDLDYTSTSALALNSGTVKDSLGNAATLTLPLPGATGSLGANKAIIIDNLPPTLTLDPADGSTALLPTLPISITFNEYVRLSDNTEATSTNVDALITLKDTDVNGTDIPFDATINSTKTVITIDPTTDFASEQTVYVAISASLEDSLDHATSAASATLKMKDVIVPTVTFDPTNGSSDVPGNRNITLTFSESIRNIDNSEITESNIAGLIDLKGNNASGADFNFGATINADKTVITVDPLFDFSASSVVYVGIGAVVEDDADNAIVASSVLYITGIPDVIGPAVSNVTSANADSSYKNGSSIIITISFDEVAIVTGTPQLTLETGTTDGVANYSSGSGTKDLYFTYNVTSDHNTAHLDYKSSNALTKNEGTIKDFVGNSANLALPNPGAENSLGANKTIVIDHFIPVISFVAEGSLTGEDKDYQTVATTMDISWTGSDSVSGISKYEYALGTTSGGTEVKTWTSTATVTSVSLSGLSLGDGSKYYASVKATDKADNVSVVKTGDGITIDVTAPTTGTVNDGTGEDIATTTSTTTLSANWTGFSDANSGIASYEYAIGTTSGGTDTKDWTNNGLETTFTLTDLTLTYTNTYFVSVRANDNAGNVSNIATSSGAVVDLYPGPPSITVASIESNSTLPVLTDTKVNFTISEPVTAATSKVTSILGDTVSGTLSIDEPTKISVEMISPFTSGDEITITIDGLTDQLGNITNNLEYIYNIALIADYNVDGSIDAADLTVLINGWTSKDYAYELGPAAGDVPNLKPATDGKYDIMDAAVLIRMWHWNLNKSGKMRARYYVNTGKDLTYSNENSGLIIQVSKEVNAIDLYFDYPQDKVSIKQVNESSSDKEIMLSHLDTLNGEFFITAGYFEPKLQSVDLSYIIKGKEDVTITAMYRMFNSRGEVFSQGTKEITLKPIPQEFALHQNYPNPFNPVTTINYDLPQQTHVNLLIYDILGREVVKLISQEIPAGYQSVIWNTRNSLGTPVSAGIYFYQIQTKGFVKTRKMVLLK